MKILKASGAYRILLPYIAIAGLLAAIDIFLLISISYTITGVKVLDVACQQACSFLKEHLNSIIVFILCLKLVCSFLAIQLQSSICATIRTYLVCRAQEKATQFENPVFINLSELTSFSFNDVNEYINKWIQSLLIIIVEVVPLCAIVFALYLNDRSATIGILGYFFITIFTSSFVVATRNNRLGSQREEIDRRIASLLGSVYAARVMIFTLKLQSFFTEKFRYLLLKHRRVYTGQQMALHMPKTVVEIMTYLGLVILISLTGDGDIGAIVPFGIAAIRLLPASQRLMASISGLQQSYAVRRKIMKID